MKRIILLIFSFVLLCVVEYGCTPKQKGKDSVEKVSEEKKEPAKKELIEFAKATNAQMPKPMPGGIRMDKVEAVSKNEYRYHYTFTQAPAITPEEFVRASKVAMTLGLQNAKGDDIDIFKKNKMTLIYAYYTMDGKLFAEVKILPEEYIK